MEQDDSEKSSLNEEELLMKELDKTIEMVAESREKPAELIASTNFNDKEPTPPPQEEEKEVREETRMPSEDKSESPTPDQPPKDAEEEETTVDNDDGGEKEGVPEASVKTGKDTVTDVNQEEEGSSKQIEEAVTPKKEETPDDIINLLKSLSPEKLKEIKSKVLEISESPAKPQNADEKAKSDELEKNTPPQETPAQVTSTTAPSDDVICLDSDDESSQPSETPPENSTAPTESASNNKRKAEPQVNGKAKETQRLKECINPECSRNAEDEYLECPSFVMSLFFVTRKQNKMQWVCTTCYNTCLETYEKLCTQVANNEPWFTVQIPKKQDLVEIIDSDEENEEDQEAASKRKKLAESEMVVFDEETEKEVEDIIKGLMTKIDVNLHFEKEQNHLDERRKKIDSDLREMQEQCKALESHSYRMYDELYSLNRPKFQRRPSLNLDVVLLSEPAGAGPVGNAKAHPAPEVSITPVSMVNRTPTSKALQYKVEPTASAVANDDTPKVCYAMRQRGLPMPHWMACKIIEDLSTPEEKKFKVQFSDNLAKNVQIVGGKEISHPNSSDKLEIGARVIALFPRAPRKGQLQAYVQRRFLPGVIGEKLTQYNKRRYLVFCDYGQVKYCTPNEVREIQESSEFVWNDVHPNLKQFIKDYLESKTNRSRALLNVRVNTQIITERGGNWRKTIVQEVDCSLVRVYFSLEHISEWLYRGSKRLYTMFQMAQRSQGNIIQRRNDPAITFIEIDDDSSNDQREGGVTKKNIAKKSTSKPPASNQQQLQHQISSTSIENQKIVILNDSKIYLEDPASVSVVKHFTPKRDICPKTYTTHECSSACIPPLKNNLSSFAPLAKPLLTCWERQIQRHNKSRSVVYKAPCGRRLRNYLEVFKYCQMTGCFLNIENFDFDDNVHVLSSLVVDQSKCPLFIPDISNGKEGMKVQCINAFDDQKPPALEYSPHRIPMPGVNIITDPEFMSCCDCKDECYDKNKCACLQMTIQGAKYKNLMEEEPDDISYVWKRLLAPVPTGIYECNSRCACTKRCLNKVVQHPIQVKMQLYRTKSRGWGLQSLHDIPKGTFICIYAGNLYSEKDANALCQGQDHGDEYFAELDLIENAEGRKDGFESGVVNPDESDQERDSDSDYDDKDEESRDYEDNDFVVAKAKAVGSREIVTRSSRTSLARQEKSAKSSASSTPQRTNSEETSSDDEMVNMMPNTENALTEAIRVPFRKLYGPKEKVYIMDAKKCGNVGRYFNHSCDPNLFVQSVFVDTHDLRFPWIAFFAVRAIKAGEELTWNYNYEVGSVPSKVLYCKCGAKNCRGRIL